MLFFWTVLYKYMVFSVLSACVFKCWKWNICIGFLWNFDFIWTENSGRLCSWSVVEGTSGWSSISLHQRICYRNFVLYFVWSLLPYNLEKNNLLGKTLLFPKQKSCEIAQECVELISRWYQWIKLVVCGRVSLSFNTIKN